MGLKFSTALLKTCFADRGLHGFLFRDYTKERLSKTLYELQKVRKNIILVL